MKRVITYLALCAAMAGRAIAQVPVPATGCYHAAFTPYYPAGGAYGHQNFDTLAQKAIAVEMFYTGWPASKIPDFPSSTCSAIVRNGSIPHITWEPWVSGSPYPLDGIIDGSYDTYIAGYAAGAKEWGKPLFIRVGHEMNGNWYPWCGTSNGGLTWTGFGDPGIPDGPERFVAAFRHIRHLFDSVGVRNVSWIWSPNNFSTPYEPWNQPESYYPGDDVVDWIGMDGYNWGTSQTWSGWSGVYDTFNEIYTRFKTSPKPLMIAEFASAEAGGDKAAWIRDAFLYTKLLFPRIKAITWFNINKETDWRINSSAAALGAYQQAVADPYFLSAVPATAVSQDSRGPVDFQFEAPVPNPSNGGVTLRFVLPRNAESSLRITNILGQEVAVLVRGQLSQGDHVVRWDARDGNAAAVPSGVYFAVLCAGDNHVVQKIIIAK